MDLGDLLMAPVLDPGVSMVLVTLVPSRTSLRRRTAPALGLVITVSPPGPVTTDLGASLPLMDPGLPFVLDLGVFATLIGNRIKPISLTDFLRLTIQFLKSELAVETENLFGRSSGNKRKEQITLRNTRQN